MSRSGDEGDVKGPAQPNWTLPEGWDVYCTRAAGLRLLRAALALFRSGSGKDTIHLHERLDETVLRAHKAAFKVDSEEGFREAMRDVLDVDGDDLETAVREVREEAMTLRGQLAFNFDLESGQRVSER